MDPTVEAKLLYRIGTAAVQLRAAVEPNEQDKREVFLLVSRLRDISLAVQTALLEVLSSNNEALYAAVNCTLERIIHAFIDTRDVAYRYLAGSDASCAFAAFSRGTEAAAAGSTAPAVSYCHSQLSQAQHELASYAHISIAMEADRLAAGGATCRMQIQLPDALNTRLAELYHLASAPCSCSDHRVPRKLAKLVVGSPAEQTDALVKLSHMANENATTCDSIAAAGGIPLLVELLSSSSVDAIGLAAGILGTLAYHSTAHQAAIAAAGGVARLMQLLGSSHPAVLCLQGRGQHHHVDSPAEQAAIQQLEACFRHCHCC